MLSDDLTRFGIDLEKDSCNKPWRFASVMLSRVSRTFALNIKVLPDRLHRPVLLAYLFCRMADTIEDSLGIDAQEKTRLLGLFSRIFNDATQPWDALAKEFSLALPAAWRSSQDDNEFLCVHCSWTIALYFELPAKVQGPVAQCIREMCEGMAAFALRQESQKGQWLTIEDEADLDRYCYFVAGVVGNMLCDLFALRSRFIGEDRHRRMRALAVSFGLGLQVTNIVKDVAEDREREVCFLPMEWLKTEGLTHPRDLFAGNAQARSRVVLRLVEKSWKHLHDALEFTLLIPLLEPRIRLFCLWPLFMAAETLVEVGDGQPVFDSGRKVKITRAAVKRIVRQTMMRCWDAHWMRKRFQALRAK